MTTWSVVHNPRKGENTSREELFVEGASIDPEVGHESCVLAAEKIRQAQKSRD